MSVRCPDGHSSESTDYCDVCGLPIEAAAGSPAAGAGSGLPTAAYANLQPTSALDLGSLPPLPGAAEKECSNCHSVVPEADLFCEVCGFDFTTGALPAPVTHPGGVPVPANQGTPDGQLGGAAVLTPAPPQPAGPPPLPSSNTLTWVAEVWVDPDWFATQESDEPCPSAGMPVVIPLWQNSVLIGRKSVSRSINPELDCGADHGVSRRHAQLTTDGQRWWAEDLQSANGTFIGKAGAPIPTTPLTPLQRVEFAPGDRVYVGAWTRVVVRKATPDEN